MTEPGGALAELRAAIQEAISADFSLTKAVLGAGMLGGCGEAEQRVRNANAALDAALTATEARIERLEARNALLEKFLRASDRLERTPRSRFPFYGAAVEEYQVARAALTAKDVEADK